MRVKPIISWFFSYVYVELVIAEFVSFLEFPVIRQVFLNGIVSQVNIASIKLKCIL